MSVSVIAHWVSAGIVLPSGSLSSGFIAVLSSFVAINTVIYVTLAVFKLLPKIYLSDYTHRRNRRRETRSIHPDDPV